MAQSDYDPSAMWIALSEYGEGNIFAIYPQLLAELFLLDDTRPESDAQAEVERLVLPSDKEWRLKQYFNLVQIQRRCSEEDGEKEQLAEAAVEEWVPWSRLVAREHPTAPPPVAVLSPPTPEWDIAEVVKAGKLLSKPPLLAQFEDEQEMRRVYSLIYDVFRYKTVLNQTLEDVHFFADFPTHTAHRHVVWLFLMELTRRRWAARAREAADRAGALLSAAGPRFVRVERDVWAQRVHFAAAVARIRIKNKAFSLCELLPPHLREERVSACVNRDLVTGWVNTFKTKNVSALIKRLKDMGYTYSSSKQLCALEYRFDRVCSRFITLRPPPKSNIGQSSLVKEGIIILQEREFCEGAAVLCRALRASALRGHIVQTHATSPRSTAYLAGQLRELAAATRAAAALDPLGAAAPDIGRLYVFGAGDKAAQYVKALREMGVEANVAPHFGGAVCVIGEAVHAECALVHAALDGVVAALATPPNSYSAVTDPIDLVCGRGGDLAMLEVLTESEIDGEGKTRVALILEEQKKTLKFLLSKPQIQLVLYETHSALETENETMVRRAVAEANRLARERHHFLRRKHHQPHATDVITYTSTGNTVMPLQLNDSCTSLGGLTDASCRVEMMDIPGSLDARPTGHRSRPASGKGLTKRPESSISRPASGSAAVRSRPIPELRLPPESIAERKPRDPDDDFSDVYVPKCDLFALKRLPNLGNGLDINYILDRDGCYLGLIQRKEITRLDAKYMIKVAEERGLFGGAGNGGHSSATASAHRKQSKKDVQARRKRGGGFEVERIAAPTYASLSRTTARRQSAPAAGFLAPDHGGAPTVSAEIPVRRCCSKHARRQAAAAAHAASVCSCDAHHKRRRRSLDGRSLSPPAQSAGPSPASAQSPHSTGAGATAAAACREPFPLRVHEVRFHLMNANEQIFA